MKPKDEKAPSLRSGFRNDSEALYVPANPAYADLTPEEIDLHRTIEQYNIVNDFLNEQKDAETRRFA